MPDVSQYQFSICMRNLYPSILPICWITKVGIEECSAIIRTEVPSTYKNDRIHFESCLCFSSLLLLLFEFAAKYIWMSLYPCCYNLRLFILWINWQLLVAVEMFLFSALQHSTRSSEHWQLHSWVHPCTEMRGVTLVLQWWIFCREMSTTIGT